MAKRFRPVIKFSLCGTRQSAFTISLNQKDALQVLQAPDFYSLCLYVLDFAIFSQNLGFAFPGFLFLLLESSPSK